MNNLDELRDDCALKQKRGIHFIIASVMIWAGITAVHLSPMNIMAKNLFTFCLSAPLMPIAFAVSKMMKIDFQNKSNPLTPLGILFSVNQIVYLLIAMWIYNALPEKMLMVYAMIFGAHLMPYSWLYRSPSYMVLSKFRMTSKMTGDFYLTYPSKGSFVPFLVILSQFFALSAIYRYFCSCKI